MPKLIMLVGLPGCGKSSWMFEHHPYTGHFYKSLDGTVEEKVMVISTDRHLEKAVLEGEEPDYATALKNRYKEAEEVMYQLLELGIKHGCDLVWDQTNLTKTSRARKLALIPEIYVKECIVFSIPENHKEILESRKEKPIPKKVIKGMRHSFEYPTHDEGFSEITHLDYFKEKGNAP